MNFLIYRYGLAFMLLVVLVSPITSNSQVAHHLNSGYYTADIAEKAAQGYEIIFSKKVELKSDLKPTVNFNNALISPFKGLGFNSNEVSGNKEKAIKVPPIVF